MKAGDKDITEYDDNKDCGWAATGKKTTLNAIHFGCYSKNRTFIFIANEMCVSCVTLLFSCSHLISDRMCIHCECGPLVAMTCDSVPLFGDSKKSTSKY